MTMHILPSLRGKVVRNMRKEETELFMSSFGDAGEMGLENLVWKKYGS